MSQNWIPSKFVRNTPFVRSQKFFDAFLKGILILFAISVCIPISPHIAEQWSFTSGVFSSFSTVSWSTELISLSILFVVFGIFCFSFVQITKLPDVPVSLWILFFAWSVFLSYIHGFSLINISFLLSWLFVGLGTYLISQEIFPIQFCIQFLGTIALFQTGIAILQTVPSISIHMKFPIGDFVLRSEYGQILRASGTFFHPNILGFFLTFCFFILTISSNFWRKYRYILLLGIFCTFSRSAFFALILGSLVYIIVNFDKQKKYILNQLIPVFASIFGFFIRHIFDTFSPSNMERMSQLQIALQALLNNFFWGTGIGESIFTFARIGNFFPWESQPLHNTFLLMIIETGVGGGVLFASIFIWTGIYFLRNRAHQYFAPFLSIFVTIVVFGMFDHLLVTSAIGLTFLALFFGFIFNSFSQKTFPRIPK